MMFTPGERLILVNQFRLLELVDKNKQNVEHYREMMRILERGYTLNYQEVTANLWTEMPETECREVMDILDMHRVLRYSFERLKDKTGVDPQKVKFKGFDGNNESSYLGYAKFLTEEQGRWEELKAQIKNSHSPMLHVYRPMLRKWKTLNAQSVFGTGDLTKEQIIEILDAPYSSRNHSPAP